MSFWSVPKAWAGQTCVILAGGPSLVGFDASSLGARATHQPFEYDPAPRVITINDSWRMALWADVHYFCDRKWWDQQYRKHAKQMEKCEGIWIQGVQNEGQMVKHPLVRHIRLSGQRGFDPDPRCLRHGSNSGYQAIHLAAHFGVARILLLGYDMRVQPNRSHWHNEERPRQFGAVIQRSFLPHFPTLVEPLRQRGVEVVNCTPGSALTCWPMRNLAEALNGMELAA